MNTILHNQALVCAAISWLCAQLLKTGIYTYLNKGFYPERLIGDGGMPSAHSASVTALSGSIGFLYGFDSPLFAISALLAIIVMHDAMGVRKVTGEQSKVLNVLMANHKYDHPEEDLFEKQLKEFVGHTPTQVVAGFVLGCIVTLIYIQLI